MVSIAGHSFNLGALGVIRCTASGCSTPDGAYYTEVLLAEETDINKPGTLLAHFGALSVAEYKQIDEERERLGRSYKS